MYKTVCGWAAMLLVIFASHAPAVAQTCVQPPQGLVAWWTGDGHTIDIQGGNYGTLQNGATFALGLVGSAFSCDGVDDFILVPDAPNLDFGPTSSPLTIEAWVFRQSGAGVQHLLGKRLGCGGDFDFYQLAIGNPYLPSSMVPLNEWTHVAVSQEGGVLSLYVNGALVATNFFPLGSTAAPLKICNSGTCDPFGGLIDEVSIYNRTLSQEEIAAIANAGSAGKCKTASRTFISPSSGGDIGSVTVRIIGDGFSPNSSVKLVREGNPDIVGNSVSVSEGGRMLSTTFDLAGKTRGLWDVVVMNPDGSSTVIPQGFTIEEGRAAQVWVDIIGQDTIRVARPQTFSVLYGNRGNVDIYDVLLYVRLPKGVSLSVNGIIMPNIEGIPANLNRPYVELNSDIVIPVWIYRIPAGSSGVFRIRITSPPGNILPIEAEIVAPPLNEEFSRTGDFAFTPFLLNRVARGIARAVVEAELGASPASAGVRSKNTIASASDIGGCLDDDIECRINKLAPNYLQEIEEAGKDAIRTFADPFSYAIGISLPIITGAICVLSPTVIVCGGLAIIDGLVSYVLPVTDLKSFVDKHVPAIVAARDPNDKVGSHGSGAPQYLSGEEPLRYAVFFENVETASAPAQEVIVTDQLDTTKMDLDTLSLGPISFGDTIVTPQPGLSAFTSTVDLRPDKELLVKVEASLDKSTGVLTWRLTSIDPVTGQLPDDPLLGFLPPNQNPPEGDGSVLFTIMPKKELPTGTEIRNQAEIVFDVNPPINTPQWFNTLDNTLPTSHVLPLAATQTSPSFLVQWAGTDAGSGIKDYTVFVSENGGPFTAWLSNTPGASGTFSGTVGKTYAFFSITTDATGNTEVKDAVAETATFTSFPALALKRGVLLLDPDPNEDRITLLGTFAGSSGSINPPSEGAAINLVDADGQIFSLSFPAGSLWKTNPGPKWTFNDPLTGRRLNIQFDTKKGMFTLNANVRKAELVDPDPGNITTSVMIGDDVFVNTRQWRSVAGGKRLVTP